MGFLPVLDGAFRAGKRQVANYRLCSICRGDPFNIHLMALSSFTHHPLAAQPIVQHSANVPVSQISVRCMGTLVGVMLHSFDADLFQQTLLIFDWNTGESKAVSKFLKSGFISRLLNLTRR